MLHTARSLERGDLGCAKIATYLEETREELRKCNWPARDELWNSTVLVFLVIVALGLFTIGSDYVILKAVRSLL
ncbi:MAG: preprotein translocase subunit SecE [Chitinophagia bacterium]|nr:preprotein translocase subunit SecE [Chitinophagia bacterium]